MSNRMRESYCSKWVSSGSDIPAKFFLVVSIPPNRIKIVKILPIGPRVYFLFYLIFPLFGDVYKHI